MLGKVLKVIADNITIAKSQNLICTGCKIRESFEGNRERLHSFQFLTRESLCKLEKKVNLRKIIDETSK